MKVLMFGWEFPPLISGGLGTACYGITRGLLKNNVDVTFIIPTRKGKKIADLPRVIGADEIPLALEEIPLMRSTDEVKKHLRFLPFLSTAPFSPYCTAMDETYLRISAMYSMKRLRKKDFEFTSGSVLDFTGDYGKNLMQEVLNYGLIGDSIGSRGSREKFDVIHAHDWLTFVAGVRAKIASKKPLIVHVHATEFDRSGENINRNVYDIEKYGMDNADRIIAVSHYTKNLIVRRYNIDPAKIEVVHNAVDRERQFERYRIKKNLKEKMVLYLGRVTMQKGPEYFLEAAALVLKKVKNVRFVMAGSGDMLPRMITRMAELKIADRFHFTGFLRGMAVEKIYAMSDLYVMTSVSEPFGLTPFEALLYDVPIIISKQSGVSEVLKNAVTINFWDVKKLAGAMVSIIQNDRLARNIVDRCKEEMKDIGWQNAANKIKQIYEAV